MEPVTNDLQWDGWVRVLRPFNSISVISRRWKGEHERLCAMKRRLGSGRISPPAGFEPATPWTEVGSANRSATRTLLTCSGANIWGQMWDVTGCRINMFFNHFLLTWQLGASKHVYYIIKRVLKKFAPQFHHQIWKHARQILYTS